MKKAVTSRRRPFADMHAWKVRGHTHTHDTRYMQNYSKLGLGQPGAGGSGSTLKRAHHPSSCLVAQGCKGASEFHDT